MKKPIKITLWAIAAAIVCGLGIFLYGAWSMFGDQFRAMGTLKMLREGVYTFEYHGDYGFDQFLAAGGAQTDAEMGEYIAGFLSKGYAGTSPQTPQGGCSTLADKRVFCRNFDFTTHGNCVIIKTFPKNGYASLSTSNFAFIGLGEDWHPVSGMDGMTALASIYIPLDGMNEKGVCVADLIDLDGNTDIIDTPRPDLTIVAAIRLVLDKAASTREALEMLRGYDVFPSIGMSHHLAISDPSGDNVVVEWSADQMYVAKTDIVTNHSLAAPARDCDPAPLGMDESLSRMERLRAAVMGDNPVEDGISALESVSYGPETIWSVIYDHASLSGTWSFGADWSEPLRISLR
ncbi:MAG: linear amide C-N hydrolase [Candidatus Cryptobacteroides sp.]